jgi:hypothetical protein
MKLISKNIYAWTTFPNHYSGFSLIEGPNLVKLAYRMKLPVWLRFKMSFISDADKIETPSFLFVSEGQCRVNPFHEITAV